MIKTVAGVDEAGRGPLAGPVMVAAVILNPRSPIEGLNDSKKLTVKRREQLADQIKRHALSFSVIEISAQTIDRLNILQATLQGMVQAVATLDQPPDCVRIDGNQRPPIAGHVETIVGGDGLDPAISAASILAKVQRDQWMANLHQRYPDYGFDRHKGYPTAQHLDMLTQLGPCPAHRMSYKPVIRALEAHQSER